MFDKIADGITLLSGAFKFMFKNPKTLFPLFISWLMITPVSIYFQYYYNWDGVSTEQTIILILIFIVGTLFLISLSSLILLELLEQIETTRHMKLRKAIKDAFRKDLIKSIPVIFIWAVLYILVTIIEILVTAAKKAAEGKNKRKKPTLKNIAHSITFDENSSGNAFSRMSFNFIKQMLRSYVFLTLPAIAWENMSSIKSMKKGLKIFKKRFSNLLVGLVLTNIFAFFVGLPVALFYYLTEKSQVEISDVVYILVILYAAFSFVIFLLVEQLYTAELYLWHLMWEKECQRARDRNESEPRLFDIPKPSFLDQIPQLKELTQLT